MLLTLLIDKECDFYNYSQISLAPTPRGLANLFKLSEVRPSQRSFTDGRIRSRSMLYHDPRRLFPTLPTPNPILNDRRGKFDIFTIYKQNSC